MDNLAKVRYEKVFKIVAGNEEKFNVLSERLKKKSNKLGLDFKYIINNDKVINEEGKQYVLGHISYELPSIGEYKLLATLEIYDNKNLVNIIDDRYKNKISKDVRDYTPYCHHCKVNRKRRYLYLVLDTKTKEVMQLGKSCSQNFIGVNNVDSLYSLVDDLGKVKSETFKHRPKEEVKYYNTIQVLDASVNLARIKYSFNRIIDDREKFIRDVITMIKTVDSEGDKALEEYAKNSVNEIGRQEFDKLKNGILKNITTRKDDVNGKEYNVYTILSKKNVRDDKVKDIVNYVINYTNKEIKNEIQEIKDEESKKVRDSNYKYPKKQVVNATFRHLVGLNNEVKFNKNNWGNDDTFNILRGVMNKYIEDSYLKDSEKELFETDSISHNIYKMWWKNILETKDRDDYSSKVYETITNDNPNLDISEFKNLVVNIAFYTKKVKQNMKKGESKDVEESKDEDKSVGEDVNESVKLKRIQTYKGTDFKTKKEIDMFKYTFETDKGGIISWGTAVKPDSALSKVGGESWKWLVDKGVFFNLTGKVKGTRDNKGQKELVVNYVKLSD